MTWSDNFISLLFFRVVSIIKCILLPCRGRRGKTSFVKSQFVSSFFEESKTKLLPFVWLRRTIIFSFSWMFRSEIMFRIRVKFLLTRSVFNLRQEPVESIDVFVEGDKSYQIFGMAKTWASNPLTDILVPKLSLREIPLMIPSLFHPIFWSSRVIASNFKILIFVIISVSSEPCCGDGY